MPQRAFRIAYDGRPYHGFQRQPEVPTVDDDVLDALTELGICERGNVPDGYAAAGRTDAGVSALAQTVAFDAPPWCSPAALNAELPADVRAWASADAPADFHATHDAVERTYRYYRYAPDADLRRARRALDDLRGEHDFHNLTPDEDGTVRRLYGTVERDGEFLVVTLRAGGFARQLVRRVVSVVSAVAGDDATLDRIEQVLSAASLDGPDGVAPAPAPPLVLADVTYPALDFAVDADAAASARKIFDERFVAATTTAAVAGAIRDGLGGRDASGGER
jgi:tRNA pseudouridine38-40 synthase